MKKKTVLKSVIVVVLFFCLGVPVSAKDKITKASLKTKEDKVSYTIGLDIGTNFKKMGVAINPDIFLKGINDSQSENNKLLMTKQEIQETMTNFRQEMRSKQMKRQKEQAQKNHKKGSAFLKENKSKQGIITRPSGLQYKIIEQGTGATPTADDIVVCHYRGTTIDKNEFDSSYKRNEPAEFEVQNVIKGWKEALQLMKIGAKWKLFIPSDLAYGERGAGQGIGPNETLIFDIELIDIKKKSNFSMGGIAE